MTKTKINRKPKDLINAFFLCAYTVSTEGAHFTYRVALVLDQLRYNHLLLQML